MRILVRESIFCCESSEWPWCFDSYDENHILRSWMQNWWESLYENQNFENWKNNTFRHSSRPKWNQRSTEGSLKKRIAKKKWNHRSTEGSFLPNFIRMFCHFLSTRLASRDASKSEFQASLQEASFSELPASEARERTTTKNVFWGVFVFPKNKHLSRWSGSQWSTRATRRGPPGPLIIFY